MRNTLPSTPSTRRYSTANAAPCRGTGLETIRTEDGPITFACTCDYCTGRERTAERIAATGDPFLGAASADDEAF